MAQTLTASKGVVVGYPELIWGLIWGARRSRVVVTGSTTVVITQIVRL